MVFITHRVLNWVQLCVGVDGCGWECGCACVWVQPRLKALTLHDLSWNSKHSQVICNCGVFGVPGYVSATLSKSGVLSSPHIWYRVKHPGE